MSRISFPYRFTSDPKLLPLLKMCTMLDPRYRFQDDATKEKLLVHAVAINCEEESATTSSITVTQIPTSVHPSSLISLLTSNSQADSVEEPTELDKESKARKEIDYYIQFTQQEKSDKLLLDWWAANGTRFPMLQEVARRFLS